LFGKLKKLRGRRLPSDPTVKGAAHKLLREQDISFYRQGLENLIVYYDKRLNKFGNYAEK
jgi:hypothetical protein